jgi:hypothetical protein
VAKAVRELAAGSALSPDVAQPALSKRTFCISANRNSLVLIGSGRAVGPVNDMSAGTG